MAKKKKLSFKFFVKTSLKPVEEGGKKYFPLYARVTYDRKSTTFRVHDKKCNPVWCSDEEGSIEKLLKEPRFKEIRDLFHLEKIVEHEESIFGEKYQIKGIGTRIVEVYLIPYDTFINGYKVLESYMKMELGNSWSFRDSFFDIFRLYHIAKFDFKDIDKRIPKSASELISVHAMTQLFNKESGIDVSDIPPPSYEWIGGKLKNDFRLFLLNFDLSNLSTDLHQVEFFFKDFPFNKSLIDKYLNIIDLSIVEEIRKFHR